MFSALDQQRALGIARSPWFAWAPVCLGLLALYVPTYATLWNGAWDSEDQAHGPLILAVVAWLFYRQRRVLVEGDDGPWGPAGWLLLLPGLLVYALGRSQDILLLEVGSHLPVLAGVVLIMRGGGALRALWFPILFLVFMVPLPGMVVDALTGPLKRHVSEAAEQLLYLAGYPIARSGVTLTIGQYQLLVADACSGMHSLYSLFALGFLYLHLVDHRDPLRTVLLASCILPVAIGANISRVVFLVLVTYYLGDEAGQGFLHGFAGMALFAVALLLLFVLDGVLGLSWRGLRPASRP